MTQTTLDRLSFKPRTPTRVRFEGLDKFRKSTVSMEIPPVPDEKGEIVDVQVLDQGEMPQEVQVAVFDLDKFSEKLEQSQPQCPRCLVPMK